MTCYDAEDRAAAVDYLRGPLGCTLHQLEQFDRLLHLLRVANEQQNLVSRSSLPLAWTRHIVDSAQLTKHVPRETSGSWLDLGSGAGFPALVCAIVRPRWRFVLVEQRRLRCDWLADASGALNLANVEIIQSRLEAFSADPFDVISARAFAPLGPLLDRAARFSTERTFWLLPKGRSAAQELDQIPRDRHMFHVEHSVSDPDAGVIVGTLKQGGAIRS